MRRERAGIAIGLLLALAAIVWAGLQPFALLPANRASWVGDGPGLRFEAGGMALSRGEVSWDTRTEPARFAMTLVVEGAETPDDGSPRDLFVLVDEIDVPALAIRQQRTRLIIADRVTNPDGERWYNQRRVDDVFADGGRRRIELEGGERLEIRIDGERVEPRRGYPIPIGRVGEPLSGRVLLGAGPDGRHAWTGTFLGLTLREGARTLADYGFTEGKGRTVHGRGEPGLDLDVPARFRSLRLPLGPEPSDARDVALNLLGFVPFGWLLGLLMRGRRRALWLVVLAGFGLSLTIELLQSLTVTRVSSLVDLVLNTLGTLAGGAIALRAAR